MDSEKVLLLYLRRLIGFCLILTVPISAIVTIWGIKFPGYLNSISGTYWTNARVLFTLFFGMTGVFLCLYKGYSIIDRIVNITIGLSMLALVIFPTFSSAVLGSNPRIDYNLFPNMNKQVSSWIHMITCAIAMIGYIFNCLFLFTKHSGEITNKKKIRNIIYKICGYSTLAVFIFGSVIVYMGAVGHPSKIFPAWTCIICQAIELLFIGIAWIIKGESLRFFNDEKQ